MNGALLEGALKGALRGALSVLMCCIGRVRVPAAIFFPKGSSLSAWFWKFNVVPSLAFTS